MTRRRLALAIAAVLAAPATAAGRPTLSGPEQTYGEPGGGALIHFTDTGADRVPVADVDGDGVSDFVEDVAAVAEEALAQYVADGFRPPRSDAALAANGGDGRVDFYLQDLDSADGHAGQDACSAGTCIGHAIVENDYAGFGYPSVGEGVRSVVPHELFHLVQYAYSDDQPMVWTEGTAVWAVEHLYGATNADFERFLPGFLGKTFRPFERDGGGFGDPYPYGAALFPRYLELAAGVDAVVAAWDGCATAPFLDALDAALPDGLAPAWADFTRWNLFTGGRAGGGMYPDATTWTEAPIEDAIVGDGAGAVEATVQIEGLSARYVPVQLPVAADWRVTVRPSGRDLRAWLVPIDGALADGVELTGDGDLVAELPPSSGDQWLVVTGLSRNTITTAIPVILEPTPDDGGGGGGGGCSTSGTPSGGGLLLGLAALGLVRRRRG